MKEVILMKEYTFKVKKGYPGNILMFGIISDYKAKVYYNRENRVLNARISDELSVAFEKTLKKGIEKGIITKVL